CSEAAVAHVFSASPLAALPLLRSWLAPTSFRLADLPLVGLAVLGLKQVDTRSDRDLRNEIFCAPYRLLGQYGGAQPDPAHAYAQAEADALAHWSLAQYGDTAVNSRAYLLDLVRTRRLEPRTAFAALAAAWRHLSFAAARGGVEDPFAALMWDVAAYAADAAESTALIMVGLHDADDKLRALLALLLTEHQPVFDPAQIEPLLVDPFHTVCFRAMQFFKVTHDGVVVQRALALAESRVYAAQVICDWHDQEPVLLTRYTGWDAALRGALAAHLARYPKDWSALNWLLQAFTWLGHSPESLQTVLPLLNYYEASTRSRASECASAIAARLPPADRTAAQRAITAYYTLECAACGHRFNGWPGQHRTGVVLHCPNCREPMLEHQLGWHWLGRHRDLNQFKARPSLLPYDAD
ncbi:MAG: hypothetical protein KA765_07205, partial [Thermoflexales bacterium]|nr:hypothetical protein [Thermoflexales bacterium]